MALFLSIFPIVLLIYLMVKRNALPSYVALPFIAALILVLQLTYFGSDFTLVMANIVSGLGAVLTPITVIFGAILFNRFSEVSGATNTLRKWLGNINPNPVAQIMIIGWAFAFMIEGASGFGTPAAIAAPILVGLGFNPLKVAVLALIMNSVPVSFGAVGTPTWFGFGPMKLAEEQILEIGSITAFIHSIAALIIPVMALRFIVSWREIRQNIVFIYISIFACVVPYLLIAQVNYEFPSLVGGAIGLFISVLVANKGIGLAKVENTLDQKAVTVGEVAKALFPTGLLIAILIITRIQQLPFKAMMNNATEWVSSSLGSFANFEISQGLIFSLKNILGTSVGTSYKLLYVPALIPFVVTVLIAIPVFAVSGAKTKDIFATSFSQTKKPFLALLGALIMVNLMLIGGDNSMVKIIGQSFAQATGEYWTIFASYLGAVGAFFSGSNTVSNLTFGSVQLSTAETTGLSVSLILALQSVGGAMGNMVCINNIVAVCSVLNITNKEGSIIKQTVIPMIIYGIIAAIAAIFIVPMIYTL
ncbi:lactate permease [Nicoletella semolina]|uniref:L-lactate permease n=1 Tax=Nicoletella semolina TaxID=271160 RepID=A0A4V2SJW3_9PAST|nr:L-lactate permease [Nicoletella semolina]MDH2923901.1 lactate permease [Nicoletella semolina]TCP17216.1 lactate permease [Nicoletella semolina]